MRLFSGLAVVISGFTLLACGSSDDSSGTGGGSSTGGSGANVDACVPAMYRAQASDACISCIESKCPSQFQALCDSQCGSASASGGAASACANAIIGIGQCGGDNCPVCVPASGGSGGGSASGGAGGASTGGSSATGTGWACTVGMQQCTFYNGQSEQLIESACGTNGVSSAHCPSANLIGCCAESAQVTDCYYTPRPSDGLSNSCVQGGGMWSTTPP